MMGTQALLLTTCMVFVLISRTTSGKIEFFTTTCTNDVICKKQHLGSECMSDPAATGQLKCGCRNDLGFKLTGSICRAEVEFNGVCDDSYQFCKQPFSYCKHGGNLDSIDRCACLQGYTPIEDNKIIKCAKILTKTDTTNCSSCIDNGGICYESFDNTTQCKCPISQIGSDCNKKLVKVRCDGHKLDVCYEAHSDVNITSASMFIHGLSTLPSCRARLTVGNSTWCPSNRLRIILDLHASQLKTCGIDTYDFRGIYKKYVAKFDVGRYTNDKHPYVFKTYCEYMFKDKTKSGVMVRQANLNDQGERKKPVLDFHAVSRTGNKIEGDVYVGDLIRLRAMVGIKEGGKPDETFTGLRVDQCVASDRAEIPDPKGYTVVIYEKGCPAKGQEYINANATWELLRNNRNEWETRPFEMFKLPSGVVIYIHCTVFFCFGNETAECQPKDCGKSSPANAPTTVAPSGNSTASSNATTAAPSNSTAANSTAAASGVTTVAPASNTTGTSNSTGNNGNGNGNGKRRKKRDVSSGTEDAGTTMMLAIKSRTNDLKAQTGNKGNLGAADALGMSGAAFAAFLAGIILILLVLIVISALMLHRMRGGQATAPDKVAMTDRPQRFAMPRNNHLRL